jgi:hypothetical protein
LYRLVARAGHEIENGALGAQVAAAIKLPERWAQGVLQVLTVAALIFAAAASAAPQASSSPALLSTAAWWEKITVTVAGNGKPQSCKYETNLRSAGAGNCEVVSSASGAAGGPAEAQFTRITFERRFSPGGKPPAEAALPLGDKLLGRHVMALAIDAAGAVQGCRIVSVAGEMTPNYGCDEAQTEKFERKPGDPAAEPRQGFLTILVYGHEEHVV